MGAGDNSTMSGLPKHLGQSHDGYCARGNDVRQDLTRSDRRKLVDVSHDQQRGVCWHGLQQRLHQHDVNHGRLVNDQEAAVERVLLIALEPSASRVNLQQTMNGLGLEPCCLRHSLGGAPGRRTEQHAHALRCENAQDGIHDGRLAHPWPPGDDQHLGGQGQPNGGNLALGERQAGLLFNPG